LPEGGLLKPSAVTNQTKEQGMDQMKPYNETTHEDRHNKLTELIDSFNLLIVELAEIRKEITAEKTRPLFGRKPQ
jgi:hypothetical protein